MLRNHSNLHLGMAVLGFELRSHGYRLYINSTELLARCQYVSTSSCDQPSWHRVRWFLSVFQQMPRWFSKWKLLLHASPWFTTLHHASPCFSRNPSDSNTSRVALRLQRSSQCLQKLQHSTDRIPSWEASSSLASQEIPRIYGTRRFTSNRHLSLFRARSVVNDLPHYFFSIHIVFTSMLRSFEWSLSFAFRYQKFLYETFLPHTCHILYPSHHLIRDQKLKVKSRVWGLFGTAVCRPIVPLPSMSSPHSSPEAPRTT